MQQDNIKVSVLTPIYNHNIEYVKQCLESLKNQTMQEIEFILIDNGATQESKDLIAEYEQLDSRFKVIHLPQNIGYGAAMNKGLQEAKGEYIGIVESDDWIKDNMYELLSEKAFMHNVDIVKADFSFNTELNKSNLSFSKDVVNKPIHKKEVPDYIFKYGSYWSAIYKRKMLEDYNILFDEMPTPSAEDIMFLIKTYICCDKLYIISLPLYIYRFDNQNSSIRKRNVTIYYTIKLYDKLFQFIKNNNTLNLPENWYLITEREFLNLFLAYRDVNIKNILYYLYLISQRFKKHLKNKHIKLNKEKLIIYKKLAYHPYFYHFRHKILKTIFSIQKSKDKKHKIITILGIKYKFKPNYPYTNRILSIGYSANKKHKIITILGFKIKLKNIKHELYNLQNRLYDMQKSNIEAAAIHPQIFQKYKNLYVNRDIAIVACGPTAPYYNPIEEVTHIGVNRAFKLPKVDLDYLFVQDFMDEEDMVEADNYRTGKCKKFYALISDLRASQVFPKIKRIPLYHIIAANAEQYVLKSCTEYVFPFDISYTPFSDIGGTALSAMQFALYTNPKRIYLIGCDCSNNGHFHAEAKNGNGPQFKSFLRWWKYLKKYLQDYNYRTEIISVNPVGLKGMFKDVYTQSYVDAHPELLNEDILILNNENEINEKTVEGEKEYV